jgi:hypothetical protein
MFSIREMEVTLVEQKNTTAASDSDPERPYRYFVDEGNRI